MRAERADGVVRVEAEAYVLALVEARPFVELVEVDGRRIARLNPIGALDTTDGLDGTASIGRAEIEEAEGEIRVTLPIESTRWHSKRAVVTCREDELELHVEIEGEGALADVRLLGGWYPTDRRWGAGWYRSAVAARTLFSPAPADPVKIACDPNEAVSLAASGGGQPGRGTWFFTPPPFVLGFSRERRASPIELPAGPWTSLSVRSAMGEQTFTSIEYEPYDNGFHLRLPYDGQTPVDGRWSSPGVVLRFGAADPYAAIADEVRRLRALGLAPTPPPSRADGRPAWWSQPIFCGWGAQSALARSDGDGSRAPWYSTQANYERFLDTLEAHGVVPGTVVIDDRWQATYAAADPDTGRWPDLEGWIARRHERGQRVLLWWKAWDPEGLPPEWCVRTRAGHAVAVDPSNPAYRDYLAEQIGRLVTAPPAGHGADGVKLDFTAQTPMGPGLERNGSEWGIELLRLLLRTIHDAAKAARPDAFVVAHAPNPGFVHVADAVRLNDLLRLDDADPLVPIVAQVRHRAAIARAACPELLVETDDWAIPSREEWRSFLAIKADLGIPSLYFADRLHPADEDLRDDDYAAIRDVWGRWRSRHGLPEPGREAAVR
ncbi:MAG TPA: hypothetical protein VFI28_02055 [Candidatus Limnocylindrales bacterium]|nr:hypothetical protein [Candidatus Limnocylindrales bacterium]